MDKKLSKTIESIKTKVEETTENVKSKVEETTSSISTNLKEKKEEWETKKAEENIKKAEEKANKKDDQEDNDSILITLIGKCVALPAVKVDRESFLRNQFKEKDPDILDIIVKDGPVDAGISKEAIKKKANKLITERTAFSTGVSFAAGIPGGFAMIATIPADIAQFYAMALRLAQELAYLYGEGDIFEDGEVDDEKVRNQLILYIGAMMGSTGAIKAVQLLSSNLAKQIIKKLPQKALTKTFYYPIVKAICKAFGVAVTKESFAKGVAKIVPIAGGVVSGGITLVTMVPMAKRLAAALEKGNFDYTKEEFDADWKVITEINEKAQDAEEVEVKGAAIVEEEFEKTKEADIEIIQKAVEEPEQSFAQIDGVLQRIKEAKEMLDAGVLTEEEFAQLKASILDKK